MMLVNASYGNPRKLELSTFMLSEVLESVVERYPFRSRVEKSYLTFGEMVNISINGPRMLLEHVYFNLMRNAFQHISIHEAPKVVLESYLSHGMLNLTITDNGQGISRKDQQRIFEKFYSTSKEYGTGLGLAFCKEVIEQHFGGSIRCISDGQSHTTIIMSIPYQP